MEDPVTALKFVSVALLICLALFGWLLMKTTVLLQDAIHICLRVSSFNQETRQAGLEQAARFGRRYKKMLKCKGRCVD